MHIMFPSQGHGGHAGYMVKLTATRSALSQCSVAQPAKGPGYAIFNIHEPHQRLVNNA